MHIKDILNNNKPSLSFEFFPPKTEKASNALFDSISKLAPLNPAYVSVTYGAGGSTRELTHDLIVKIKKETKITVISHLTCVGASKGEIHNILEQYAESGISNIMALRGDPPKVEKKFTPPKDGFAYAGELVSYIKKHFPKMGIGVAGFPEGHPETPNRILEIENLKRKVDAGADYICTQLFFDNNDYFDFVERCEIANINVPIVAGVMPITSLSGMSRMAELALGARVPAKLLRAIERAGQPEAIENLGIHWATQQVLELLDNEIPGIHFYTLNKSKPTLKIYDALGVRASMP